MPKSKNPFKIEECIAYVFYDDEEGSRQSFMVKALSTDSLIERLGAVERKLEALRSQNNVNQS